MNIFGQLFDDLFGNLFGGSDYTAEIPVTMGMQMRKSFHKRRQQQYRCDTCSATMTIAERYPEQWDSVPISIEQMHDAKGTEKLCTSDRFLPVGPTVELDQ